MTRLYRVLNLLKENQEFFVLSFVLFFISALFSPPLTSSDNILYISTYLSDSPQLDLTSLDLGYGLLVLLISKIDPLLRPLVFLKLTIFSFYVSKILKELKEQRIKKLILLLYCFSFYLIAGILFLHKSSLTGLLIFLTSTSLIFLNSNKNSKIDLLILIISSSVLLTSRLDTTLFLMPLFLLFCFKSEEVRPLVIKTIPIITLIALSTRYLPPAFIGYKQLRSDAYFLLPVIHTPPRIYKENANALNAKDLDFISEYLSDKSKLNDLLNVDRYTTEFPYQYVKEELSINEIINFYVFTLKTVFRNPIIFLKIQGEFFFNSTYHLKPKGLPIIDVYERYRNKSKIPNELIEGFSYLKVNHKTSRNNIIEKAKSSFQFSSNYFLLRELYKIFFSPFMILLGSIIFFFRYKSYILIPYFCYTAYLLIAAPKQIAYYYNFILYLPLLIILMLIKDKKSALVT